MTGAGVPRRCYERACPERRVLPCDFVDRHGRHCVSTWCSRHGFVVSERNYCRRHAGVVGAFGDGRLSHSVRPELENRAPSLVNWVSTAIDPEVQALLDRYSAGRDGAVLAMEPVHLVVGVRGRRWSRSWCLRDAHGHDRLRVSIEVDEQSDPEIAVRVDGDVVTRTMAPWIAHRLRGEWVSAPVDSAERERFNADVVAVIAEVVDETLGSAEPR